MATPVAERRREQARDLLIVDADVHVHDTHGALAPYCAMPRRKSLAALALFKIPRPDGKFV